MKTSHIREIYDRSYAQNYNQRFLLNDLSKVDADFEREIITQLLNEVGDHPTWLDVACGTGYFLSCFPEVERAGLDISPAMLEAAQKSNPDILLAQGDYRDQRLQWEDKWDLVSCMWWAYCYVESLTELEAVVENFARWTSVHGICFVPIFYPNELGSGDMELPYISKDLGEGGGFYQFEAVVWSWIEDDQKKQHLNLIAPHPEYIVSLFKKHFEQVEIINYPKHNRQRIALVARQKKIKHQPVLQKATDIKFTRLVRLHDWWLYKIPPLLAIAYAEILLFNCSIPRSFLTVSALLFAIACIAAYGYLINDSFDVEGDQQVGKFNSMAKFFPWQRALFCLTFVGIGFSLPILLNFGTLPIMLLGINYLLPTLYSATPFRFKERGILGIISDAAGAHAIPTLFIATTFTHLVAAPSRQITALTIAATAWAFFAGLRGILLHQIWDRDDDLKSSVKTFLTESSVETVRFWINRCLFPLEMLLLGALILVITPASPLVLVFTVFYFLLKLTLTQFDPISSFDPAPVQKAYVIPHDFYEVGLPLILVTILALQNPWFIILLLLHVVLFYPGFKRRITNLIQFIRKPPEPPPVKLTQPSSVTINDPPQPSPSQLDQFSDYLEHVNDQLHRLQGKTYRDWLQTKTDLDQLRTELAHVKADSQASQTETAQLKAFLKTQAPDLLVDYYQRVITANPDDLHLYDQVLALQPQNAQLYLQLGNRLVQQGQLNDAITRYQTAIQHCPDHFDLHLALAKTLESNKCWEAAVSTYKTAIALSPDNPESHQHLGDALAHQGQTQAASLAYRQALKCATSAPH